MALSIPIISEFDGKGIDRAIKEFKQLETAGEKAQFAIKKAAIPAAAALAGLAAAAGPAISAASDLEENLSKVNVIFGEGAKEIEEFAKTAATALGQSQNAVLQAAGTFGTFGKAAGLGGLELATFSNDFTALASDLASFNNTSPEEAINAIGSALRGEAEPLRKFGVLLNDATLKEAALSLGIYEGSGALTAQQKILAAQEVIYKQTGDAQGDFGRTSDGLANSQRILTAQIKDLQVEIGKALLPVVKAVLPLLKDFASWATANPGAFKIIGAAIAGIAASIVAVNIAMALNPFGIIMIGIGALITGLTIAYTKFEGFRTVVQSVMNSIIGYFEGVANAFISLINVVVRGINLISPGSDINSISSISLPTIGGSTGSAVSGGGFGREGGTGNIGVSLPSLPSLPASIVAPPSGGGGGRGGSGGGGGMGSGGIVSPVRGIQERIADRESQPININITGGLATSAEIGRAVTDSLKAYNRQSGPLEIEVIR